MAFIMGCTSVTKVDGENNNVSLVGKWYPSHKKEQHRNDLDDKWIVDTLVDYSKNNTEELSVITTESIHFYYMDGKGKMTDDINVSYTVAGDSLFFGQRATEYTVTRDENEMVWRYNDGFEYETRVYKRYNGEIPPQ